VVATYLVAIHIGYMAFGSDTTVGNDE